MKPNTPRRLHPFMVALRVLLAIGLLVPDLLLPMQRAMDSGNNPPPSIA